MNIDTVRFSHLLEVNELNDLNYFLSHTAFVISHKSESIETLLGVLWYLPSNSPIIIVTNCPEEEKLPLERGLREKLTQHKQTYLVHQKDAFVAKLLRESGVSQIVGEDGRVVNGKGEGMYIGTLFAAQLGYAEWVIYYDADNFVPSALLEYTMAMSRLFMAARVGRDHSPYDLVLEQWHREQQIIPELHNIRICWSSKPELGNTNSGVKLLGRCTRVVSPLFTTLLDSWFKIRDYPVISSNAGEQGMTMRTATTIRFSSGYSVETFQFLDLLYHASHKSKEQQSTLLQQYSSQSPHFHDKKDDQHIKKMIADSLGAFTYFESILPRKVRLHLQAVCQENHLEPSCPRVYPEISSLSLEQNGSFANYYRLFRVEEAYPVLSNGLEIYQYENEEEVPCVS